MSSYDQNEDGRLSYQEFLIYMMDKEKKWKIDFHALDRNKCGKLSLINIHIFCLKLVFRSAKCALSSQNNTKKLSFL